MREVEAELVSGPSKSGLGRVGLDDLPTHVRHRQADVRSEREATNLGIEPTEPVSLPSSLERAISCMPEADAEDRHLSLEHRLVEHVDEAEVRQSIRRAVERPDPGQDELVRAAIASGSAVRTLGADLSEHVLDGPEIAHPVVDDDDQLLVPSTFRPS